MTPIDRLLPLLPVTQQREILVSTTLEALARYSVCNENLINYEKTRALERNGELTLMDRLSDCLPTEGCSWLHDVLWDHRDGLFEAALGDTGEEWLAAIMGPTELDEFNAGLLQDAISDIYDSGECIPAWADRKAPPIPELVNFLRDWREVIMQRLLRRIVLPDDNLGSVTALEDAT